MWHHVNLNKIIFVYTYANRTCLKTGFTQRPRYVVDWDTKERENSE